MKLTPSQIAGYARGAGFSESAVQIAVAIALAESGGNTQAFNGTAPDRSYGLWQINMYGNLAAERMRQFQLSKESDLFNPMTNASAAYVISRGGSNWRPWSTFTNGAYRQFINAYQPDVNQIPGSPGGFAVLPFLAGYDKTTLMIGAAVGLLILFLLIEKLKGERKRELQYA